MRRARALSSAILVVLIVATFFVGYGVALVVDEWGLNALLASAAVAVVLAVFAWFLRDREIIEVAAPSFFVAYAGYAGVATARVGHTIANLAGPAAHFYGPLGHLGSLDMQWPLVLAAGVPFALVLTVAVALPISMIPVRRKIDTQAQDALWKFVQERNAEDARHR